MKKLTKEDIERTMKLAVEHQKKYFKANPKSVAWWMAAASLNKEFTPVRFQNKPEDIKHLQKYKKGEK